MRRGEFLGLDETGGMILKTDTGSDALPLMPLLDAPRVWPPEALI